MKKILKKNKSNKKLSLEDRIKKLEIEINGNSDDKEELIYPFQIFGRYLERYSEYGIKDKINNIEKRQEKLKEKMELLAKYFNLEYFEKEEKVDSRKSHFNGYRKINKFHI